MKTLDEELQEIEELIDGIEGYDYSKTTKLIMDKIRQLVEEREKKIEEAEKRGRENISIGVLQSIENLYKLWSPEPIFPSSPINQLIRELQDLVLKSNLTDK